MDKNCRKRKRELGGARYKTINEGGVPKSAEMAVDRWLDLPSGPLGQIFSKLNPIEIILVIPLVCKYWGQIFLKGLFSIQENSKCLDFSSLLREPFYSFFCQLGDENARARRLMNVIVGMMHAFASESGNDAHSSAARPTSITNINICGGLPFHDRHLVYIASRCPGLRCVFLSCVKNFTVQGISRTMRYWSCLDSMTCGPFHNLHLPRIIEEIGVNCKNLHSIVLNNFEFQWQSAELIVRNLKSLEILTLNRAEISKYGLHIFLSRWKKPITVYFYSCFYTNDKDRDNVLAYFKIWNIRQDRRIKWKTDIYSDTMGKLYTSKGLTDLIFTPLQRDAPRVLV